MKNLTLKYRVASISGGRAFPIDMLRYDGAYPASEIDSNKITDTFWYMSATTNEGRPSVEPIELVCTFNGCPNGARWHGFGWHVTHVWNGYEWEQYNPHYRNHRVTR